VLTFFYKDIELLCFLYETQLNSAERLIHFLFVSGMEHRDELISFSTERRNLRDFRIGRFLIFSFAGCR
jgi:hypothetical protein